LQDYTAISGSNLAPIGYDVNGELAIDKSSLGSGLAGNGLTHNGVTGLIDLGGDLTANAVIDVQDSQFIASTAPVPGGASAPKSGVVLNTSRDGVTAQYLGPPSTGAGSAYMRTARLDGFRAGVELGYIDPFVVTLTTISAFESGIKIGGTNYTGDYPTGSNLSSLAIDSNGFIVVQNGSSQATLLAGDGLVANGTRIDVDLATNSGLELTATNGTGELRIKGLQDYTAVGLSLIGVGYDAAGNVVIDSTALLNTAKHAETITGDGTTTSFAVNHAKGTKDIVVQVYDITTDELVDVAVDRTDNDNIAIVFAAAPSGAESFRVIVV
jgi:hypothetical protein